MFCVLQLEMFDLMTYTSCFKSGYMGIDLTGCEAKSCCWVPSSTSGLVSLGRLFTFTLRNVARSTLIVFISMLHQPWCFYQSGAASTSCFGTQMEMKEPFSKDEVSTMRNFFVANTNIQGKGGIVAAPDTNTPGGSYYYQWMWDGIFLNILSTLMMHLY